MAAPGEVAVMPVVAVAPVTIAEVAGVVVVIEAVAVAIGRRFSGRQRGGAEREQSGSREDEIASRDHGLSPLVGLLHLIGSASCPVLLRAAHFVPTVM